MIRSVFTMLQSDDAVSMCCSLLNQAGQQEQARHLQSFQAKIWAGINKLHSELLGWGASVTAAVDSTGGALMDAVPCLQGSYCDAGIGICSGWLDSIAAGFLL